MGLYTLLYSQCSCLEAAVPTLAATQAKTVQLMWQMACAVADKYIGRDLSSSAATEYYDGSPDVYLNLRRWPVTAISEVKRDMAGGFGQVPDSFGTDTILVQGTDYILDSRRGILQIIREWRGGRDWFARGYAFPPANGQYGRGLVAAYMPASWGQALGSVKVTYTAGLTECPQDLIAAVVQIGTYLLKINETGGLILTSTSYIDVTEKLEVTQAVSELRGGIPELGTARQILDYYRSPGLGTGWVL